MSESIDELRHRWESDPSPQLSLQLAEEYRRLDRRDRAIEVLAKALEDHPRHVAARVAMGRYRLEMGDTDAARQLLEAVVAEDPTHLVAGKLLVELYIEIDDRRQARDRLDLYRLLNEGDPAIEQLERRLAAELEEAASSRPVEDRPIRLVVPGNGDPFGDLTPGTATATYWLAVAAEGIFPVAASGLPTTAGLVPESVPELPAATVTLANLYLQQGHLDDAEAAFREVLERQPYNAAARSGIEEIQRQRSVGLQAADIGAEELPATDARDRGTRKIAALQDYLQRLRAAANRN